MNFFAQHEVDDEVPLNISRRKLSKVDKISN